MEARSKNLQDWFSLIREGELSLPRFQRYEAWTHPQVASILENILLDEQLPIGALLTLEIGDKELFHSRNLSEAPALKAPKMNLLDGQQRITALWRSLNGLYDDCSYFVSFKEQGNPEVTYQKRWENHKTKKRMPLWADDPQHLYKNEQFPLTILCPGTQGEKAMSEWLDCVGINHETYKEAHKKVYPLREKIATYPIPFLSLPVKTAKETALDVYIKMNTSASPLKAFDIVVAQMEASMGDSLHNKVKALLVDVPELKRYGNIENIVLAVGALLNGKPPLKSTFLESEFGRSLADVWPDVVKGLKRGIRFLHEERIFNEHLLPTEVVLYLISALWARIPEDGVDVEGVARTLMRKALWRGCVTERYTKTATTRAFADYTALCQLLEAPSSVPVELFDEDVYPLPKSNDLIMAGWPARKDRLGRAIIVASLYFGGYDFADGSPATVDNISKREYHHIYPRALVEGRYKDHEVSSAINCARISWKTNRVIEAKSPKQYISDRSKEVGVAEEVVKQRLESHLISYDVLITAEFRDFLEDRARKVQNIMRQLCNGNIPKPSVSF